MQIDDVKGAFMVFATMALCDQYENHLAAGSLRVLEPVFQSFGREKRYAGPVVTLKLFEDNALIQETLQEDGAGRVLVVDGGGSMRCGIIQSELALLAEKNRWSGLIVYGCVRETAELNVCNIGIHGLASHPRGCQSEGIGKRDVIVRLPGSLVAPGNWIYADEDGLLVSNTALS